MAEPEDPPAETGGRESQSSTSMDTDQPENDSAEPAEHDTAASTADAGESSDDKTDRNNGSTPDTAGHDDHSPDDNTDDDSLDDTSPDNSAAHDSDDTGDMGDTDERHDAAEDANDSSEHETADDVSGDENHHHDDAEEDEDASPKPLPPLEPVPFIELMAAYRQPATAGGERLPWSWATLSPAERATSATLLDGFVKSYNRTWAISQQQIVPPCWRRHPALAHDLAALAWAYYQAYRDPMATPDRALQFQAGLLPFAKRMNRWLGSKPGECRAGQHAASWRDADGITSAARRSTTEDTDAVTLLGEETFGFATDSTDHRLRPRPEGPISDT